MASLDDALWQQLSPILDAAFELPPQERDAYLDRVCAGDTRLREAARALLDASERTQGILERRDDLVVNALAASGHAAGSGYAGSGPGALREEGFLPGVVIADRYRIVSLLGRGGMGEVYRCDDMKLGQPVALKFLSRTIAHDSERVDRLIGELKTARYVAHPNVCRMWDLGEHQGATFLSMEYVDGESLASLLKRIGRLPVDKALDVARQLCAGLAAAHDIGILHRDLKPANVMVDGRGRVRIADFGIAAFESEIRGREIAVGTPGYMAPEQIDGREATIRSDVYSLGLVLYEVFTGKRPFEAKTTKQLRILQDEATPVPLTGVVTGLDPVVDRIVLQCLAPDPAERPRTAAEVGVALPGGDPLQAAIAAGETPSPGLVAASGPRGGLSKGAVLRVGIVWVAALAFLFGAARKASVLGWVPSPKPTQALAVHARELLQSYGYTTPPRDHSAAIVANMPYLGWLQRRGAGARWDSIARGWFPPVLFVHRESPRYLIPLNVYGDPLSVGSDDPPLGPGGTMIVTDLQGRLFYFIGSPPDAEFRDSRSTPFDWNALFAASGLSRDRFAPIRPTRIPPVPFDARAAWSGILRETDNLPIRIEAATWRGRPVHFEIIQPWDPYWSEAGSIPRDNRVANALWMILILTVTGVGGWFVLRNLRLGRGDRKGALRFAIFLGVCRMLWWVLGGHHVPDFRSELFLAGLALGRSLFVGGVVWALYIALEPTLRRLWPQLLIGWSRLLQGRIRDPLVGRDILVGSAAGLLFAICWSQLYALIPRGLPGIPSGVPMYFPGPVLYSKPSQTLLGGAAIPAGLLAAILSASYMATTMAIYILGLLVLVRKKAVVIVIATIFGGVLSWVAAQSGYTWTGVAAGLLGSAILNVVLARFGVLAAGVAFLMVMLYSNFPITTDVSSPYFGIGLVGLLAMVGVGAYGAWVAGSQPGHRNQGLTKPSVP